MDDDYGDSYRYGFETALELCITRLNKAGTKEKAMAKLMEYLGLVKEDKMVRVEEDLWNIRH